MARQGEAQGSNRLLASPALVVRAPADTRSSVEDV